MQESLVLSHPSHHGSARDAVVRSGSDWKFLGSIAEVGVAALRACASVSGCQGFSPCTLPWTRSIALAVTLTALGGCGRKVEVDHVLLQKMHETCVAAMIRSTCLVTPHAGPRDGATTVVIAGVGAVDAHAYRALLESGEAMCGVAKRACELEWSGGTCRSARALWSMPPA